MIHTTNNNIHWNYFIALEKDLEDVSRYIEFNRDNFDTYSIELAHLLFASASEVDVMAKLLCKKLQPTENPNNIDQYKLILKTDLPEILDFEIFLNRYGLSFEPWESWIKTDDENPLWWRSYNKVKHNRDVYFNEATLKNVLNALGALLILNYYYYSYELSTSDNNKLSAKDTTRQLEPKSTLLTLPDDFYYGNLLV